MKRIIPLIIILAALGGGYWWYTQQSATAGSAATDNRLLGSGSIEAETLAITAELGGRVESLTVAEGDVVEAGQVLIALDKTDLLAQQVQLEAAIATAKANLALVSAPPRPENVLLAEAQLAQAEE
jgi:multidrug efflux pump subunit AcrA (membrane-fusion protein)